MWWRLASVSSLISSSRVSVARQATYKLNLFEVFSTGIETLVFAHLPLLFFPSVDENHSLGTSLLKDVSSKTKAPFITFVLGGPGSGKGTQCAKIVEAFGFKHLSAGDLLRKEISSDSEYGSMILNTIKEGKIVPSGVTVQLIKREIESSECQKFLIDGFPRSEENRIAFERVIETEPDIVLFFDCPEDEMVKRVLNRNQGRVDDNVDTVKKRLKVFEALNIPVINYYSNKGKLYKIDGVGTVDEVFERVRPVFSVLEKDLQIKREIDRQEEAI